MEPIKADFFEFVLNTGALTFGEFKLKSGRISPYFFNAGLFNDGSSIGRLGYFYASSIQRSQVACDMLYGPAYKGIPLVTSAAIALAGEFGRNLDYAFNRKEIKDHGEGGQVVGSPLSGRVAIIDDVITAGLSVEESVAIIQSAGAQPAGVFISLDREEKLQHASQSASQAIEEKFDIPVIAIAGLGDLVAYLSERPDSQRQLERIKRYSEHYGASRDRNP